MQAEARERTPDVGRRAAGPAGILAALAGIYLAAFLAFYPQVPMTVDEHAYVLQSQFLLRGGTSLIRPHPVVSSPANVTAAQYPLGTSLTMAPFIALLGERGAFLPPLLGLLAGVLFTALWLRSAARPVLFAGVVLGFPASLAMGRMALSDAPSLGLVALGLWLFWRGIGSRPSWWLGSGFVAGASLLFRETNVIPFAGFFAGALLRRERNTWALVVGGLLGTSLRLVSSQLAYGDPFFAKTDSGFGLQYVSYALPLHLFGLLFLVPGGLAAALLYRGPRWQELLASVVVFLGVYVSFVHQVGAQSTQASRVILELRYYLPLLPLLAFALADVVPRLGRRILEGLAARRRRLARRLAAAALALWVGGLATAAVGVNGYLAVRSRTDAAIRDTLLAHVETDAVVVSNAVATMKYFPVLAFDYPVTDIERLSDWQLEDLVRRHAEYYLVILDRTDGGPWWLARSRQYESRIASLEPVPRLVLDTWPSPTRRLRIWRVAR